MVFGVIVSQHNDIIHRLNVIRQLLRLVLINVGHHDFGSAICNEFLFHQIQTLSGLCGTGKESGQIIFHLNPVHGNHRKDNGNAKQQKKQVSSVYNKCGNLHHEIALFFYFVFL